MSEEEAIKILKDLSIDIMQDYIFSKDEITEYDKNINRAINMILDLYNKEKEKNEETFIKMYYKHDFVSKDKIREKIKELEKEQEENRKNFSRGIEFLSTKIIDKFSDKIMINYKIREYLQELLLEESE